MIKALARPADNPNIMFVWLISLVKGLFSTWLGWRSNRDQDVGRLQQQNKNMQEQIKADQNAQRIEGQVASKSDAELDADLTKRM